ncbi:hypothetical protein MXAN_5621 [Myxococcus xanthus DK 1622]|uniref:Uncharacterized protein n=3 Tax=Myxococcus TaxID=32 RepID=Q1D0R3_MYXXD|nr:MULTISPECIES: hypothetical protein [Myxococcus]ABF90456.1 hypothetical protein MXAN_5621 [Myxococcus xanthus DK 1622]NOJ54021.1 hypothetical protein [Myxococcus xanthus]NOJ79105.1 hypothetical protein [Myxococcus xanthus]NOJ88605.1 hypothetical protein [Myxococcus xanthus]QDE70522.1 hypothetical protein BHS09_28125 [Myxococcus xanthus]
MKKLVAVAVFGLMGTLGMAARVDARPGVDGMEPTDAQVEAALDARQKLVLGNLLRVQQTDARTAAIHR